MKTGKIVSVSVRPQDRFKILKIVLFNQLAHLFRLTDFFRVPKCPNVLFLFRDNSPKSVLCEWRKNLKNGLKREN